MTKHLTAYARLNVITPDTVSDVLANTEEDLRRLIITARTARRLAVTLRKIQRHTTDPCWTKAAKTVEKLAARLEGLAGSSPQPVAVPIGSNIVALLLDAYDASGKIDANSQLVGSYRVTIRDRLWKTRTAIACIRIDLSDWLCDLDAHPTKVGSSSNLREWRKSVMKHPR